MGIPPAALVNHNTNKAIYKERKYEHRKATCRIGVHKPRIESDISTKNIANEHILELYYSCVQDGDMLPERAAKRLNISVPELQKRMQEQGYHFPQ